MYTLIIYISIGESDFPSSVGYLDRSPIAYPEGLYT